MTRNTKSDLALTARALGDETRLLILYALNTHHLSVTQLSAFLGRTQSAVSRHLSILKNAGLIHSHRSGRWIIYYRAEGDVPPVPTAAWGWFETTTTGDRSFTSQDFLLDQIAGIRREEWTRDTGGP